MAGFFANIGKWLVIARVWTFSVDFAPVTIGTLLALPEFNPLFYALMLIGVVSLNAFANIANDIYDFRNGADRTDDPAVHSRHHPLITGSATVRQLQYASVATLLIAAACGIYITAYRGPLIPVIGIAGILIAFFYTAGRSSIKSLALGELAVFAVYGPLITVAAFFVESGDMAGSALLASVPIGISIMLVLLANNLRDMEADRVSGIRTLVVRIGRKRGMMLFYLSFVSIYAALLLLIAADVLPIAAALSFASILYTVKINLAMKKKMPANSAELVSRFVLILAALLAAGLILNVYL